MKRRSLRSPAVLLTRLFERDVEDIKRGTELLRRLRKRTGPVQFSNKGCSLSWRPNPTGDMP